MKKAKEEIVHNAGDDGKALAKIDDTKAIQQWLRLNLGVVTRSIRMTTNGSSYSRGFDQGKKIKINPGVESDQGETKYIGGE